MRRALALARWALVTEWRMYVGAARLLARRPDVPDEAMPVHYVGAVSVLLWAITAVSLVELVALHVILPWESVRLAADVLGVWGLVWCVGFTACHYVYPHLATSEALVLRVGHRRPVVSVPMDAVAGVRVRERSLDDSRSLAIEDRVARVSVARRTNVELVLLRPIRVEVPCGLGGTRGRVTHEVDEVRVYVDEPRLLADLVRRHQAGGAVGTFSPI